MFEGCYKLKNIVIPDNVEKINEGAFWNCRNLESVTIGKNVKEYWKVCISKYKIDNNYNSVKCTKNRF